MAHPFVSNSIAESIIELLTATPGLTAQSIHDALRQKKGNVSQSGLYKELKRLSEIGVLFKVEQTYRLHLNWVLEFLNFAETLEANYLESNPFLPELPQQGEKLRWRLTNLYRLNDLFTNVVLRLIKETNTGLHLSWNYHPWFHLIQARQEQLFFRALTRSKVRMYKIIGRDTPLDRWSEQFWDQRMVTWSYAESPFHSLRQTYFSVLDDFVVKVEITAKTARRLDDLYTSSENSSSKRSSSNSLQALLEPRILSLLFDDRSPAYLTLSRNKKEAASIHNKFKDYFGVLLPGNQ